MSGREEGFLAFTVPPDHVRDIPILLAMLEDISQKGDDKVRQARDQRPL